MLLFLFFIHKDVRSAPDCRFILYSKMATVRARIKCIALGEFSISRGKQ